MFGFLSHGAFGAHGELRTIDGSIANGYRHLSGNTSLDCFIHGISITSVGELHRLGCHESSVIDGCVDQLLHLEGANLLDVGVGHGRDVVGNLALLQGDSGVQAIGLECMTSDISISFASDLALRAHGEACSINEGAVSIDSQLSVSVGLNSTIDRIGIALVEQLHRRGCVCRLRVSNHLFHLERTRLLGVRICHSSDIACSFAFSNGHSGVQTGSGNAIISDISIGLAGDLTFGACAEHRAVDKRAIGVHRQLGVSIGFHRAIHRVSVALVEQLHRLRSIRRLRISNGLLYLERAVGVLCDVAY